MSDAQLDRQRFIPRISPRPEFEAATIGGSSALLHR